MSRPVPNPGILDIAPYTPGKSPVPEPGRKMFKLSANETPFGPSPKAIAAYKQAAEHLEDYPEGTSRVLREAIGRAFGLDPDRIICGAGSDEILNLLAHTYLKQGDEALKEAHVSEFEIKGRGTMKGWVVVSLEGVQNDDRLKGWIERAVEFVGKLPAK